MKFSLFMGWLLILFLFDSFASIQSRNLGLSSKSASIFLFGEIGIITPFNIFLRLLFLSTSISVVFLLNGKICQSAKGLSHVCHIISFSSSQSSQQDSIIDLITLSNKRLIISFFFLLQKQKRNKIRSKAL